MKFKPEAYFVDIDGTLCDEPELLTGKESTVSKENLEAVNKVAKHSPVILATGRGPKEPIVAKILTNFDASYAICQNGATIINNKLEEVKVNQLSKVKTRALLDYCKKEKLYIIVDNTQFIYGPDTNVTLDRPWVKEFTFKLYEDIPYKENVRKILAFGKNLEGMAKLKEELPKIVNGLTVSFVSKGLSIEITDIKASKGKVSLYMAKKLSVNPLKCVHIGDSGNDISAAQYLGGFIAMGNAADYVKEKADYIGPNFRPAGIAKLFKMIENNEI